MTDDAQDVVAALEGTWRVGQRVLVVSVPGMDDSKTGVPYVGTVTGVADVGLRGYDRVAAKAGTEYEGEEWWIQLDQHCRRIEGES